MSVACGEGRSTGGTHDRSAGPQCGGDRSGVRSRCRAGADAGGGGRERRPARHRRGRRGRQCGDDRRRGRRHDHLGSLRRRRHRVGGHRRRARAGHARRLRHPLLERRRPAVRCDRQAHRAGLAVDPQRERARHRAHRARVPAHAPRRQRVPPHRVHRVVERARAVGAPRRVPDEQVRGAGLRRVVARGADRARTSASPCSSRAG